MLCNVGAKVVKNAELDVNLLANLCFIIENRTKCAIMAVELTAISASGSVFCQ